MPGCCITAIRTNVTWTTSVCPSGGRNKPYIIYHSVNLQLMAFQLINYHKAKKFDFYREAGLAGLSKFNCIDGAMSKMCQPSLLKIEPSSRGASTHDSVRGSIMDRHVLTLRLRKSRNCNLADWIENIVGLRHCQSINVSVTNSFIIMRTLKK